MQNAQPEEVELGAAIHVALDNLQAIDMPFNRAVTPLKFQGSTDSAIVLAQTCCEGLELRNSTGLSISEPWVKSAHLAMPNHEHESLSQLVSDCNLKAHLAKSRPIGVLFS